MSGTHQIKRIIAGWLWIAALCIVPGAYAQFDLSNIQFVVGTGTNESALVIDWNESITPDTLVWGYKWNMPASGVAPTVYAMLQAIEAADPRLQTTANPKYDSPSTGVYAIYSVFFDLTGDGGSPVVGLPLNLQGSENGYPPNPGDLYREGWYTGFWGELAGVGTHTTAARGTRLHREALRWIPSATIRGMG